MLTESDHFSLFRRLSSLKRKKRSVIHDDSDDSEEEEAIVRSKCAFFVVVLKILSSLVNGHGRCLTCFSLSKYPPTPSTKIRSSVGAPIRALFDGLSHLFVATGDSRRRRLAATTADLRLAPSLTPGPSPSKKRRKG